MRTLHGIGTYHKLVEHNLAASVRVFPEPNNLICRRQRNAFLKPIPVVRAISPDVSTRLWQHRVRRLILRISLIARNHVAISTETSNQWSTVNRALKHNYLFVCVWYGQVTPAKVGRPFARVVHRITNTSAKDPKSSTVVIKTWCWYDEDFVF